MLSTINKLVLDMKRMVLAPQLYRFAIVGLSQNLAFYLIYLVITWLGVGPKTAMTGLYIVAVIVTFILNRSWSFRHDGRPASSFFRYLIAYLIGYILNFSLLWIAVDVMEFPHQIIQAIAIFLLGAFFFLVLRFWVFPSAVTNHPSKQD